MNRIKYTVASVLSLVVLAAVAPVAASAANVPSAVLYSGGVPGAVKPNPKRWAVAPAVTVQVVRPNPTCPGCALKATTADLAAVQPNLKLSLVAAAWRLNLKKA